MQQNQKLCASRSLVYIHMVNRKGTANLILSIGRLLMKNKQPAIGAYCDGQIHSNCMLSQKSTKLNNLMDRTASLTLALDSPLNSELKARVKEAVMVSDLREPRPVSPANFKI